MDDNVSHTLTTTTMQEPKSNWGMWIVIIVVVIIIILVLFFVYESGGDVINKTTHIWTVTTNTTQSATTFAAESGNMFVNQASGNLSLLISSPTTDIKGQEFIIDNRQGNGIITLGTGYQIYGSSTIPANASYGYVWLSATQFTQIF